jgi:hypothetical protein
MLLWQGMSLAIVSHNALNSQTPDKSKHGLNACAP